MRSLIRKTLDFFLGYLGFKLARTTQHVCNQSGFSELSEMIRKLRPVPISTELIRFGPQGDGGYLIPNDLEGVVACFSPGVSSISGFELECAKKGMSVYLADNSVESPNEHHHKFFFTKKFIGAFNDRSYISVDSWVSSGKDIDGGDLMLQMDIEGFEYEAILNLSHELQRQFRIIVVEFHSLDELWNKAFFNIASRTFDKLLTTHRCIHIHPNNYAPVVQKDGIEIAPLLEMTFLRNDRVEIVDKNIAYPHPLDCDNTNNPSFPLPKTWYQPD